MKFSRVCLLALTFVVLCGCVAFGATREEFSAELKKAQRGYAWAQFRVGVMYYDGEGVKQDYERAVEWYRKAAAHGLVQAQHHLGWMYENGEGGEAGLQGGV